MKAGKQHCVPLSPQAIEVLKTVQTEENGRYVFPGQREGKPQSPVALAMALRRMGVDVTARGFRSSFRDWRRSRRHIQMRSPRWPLPTLLTKLSKLLTGEAICEKTSGSDGGLVQFCLAGENGASSLMIISEATLMEPTPLISLSEDELESVIGATGVPLRAHVSRDRLKVAINELAWPNLADTFPVLYPVERLDLLDRVVTVIDEYLADERNQREYDEMTRFAAPLSAWAMETKSWLRMTRKDRVGHPSGAWIAEFDVRALAVFAAAFEIGSSEPPTTYQKPENRGDGPTARLFKAPLKGQQHRAREECLLALDAKERPIADDVVRASHLVS